MASMAFIRTHVGEEKAKFENMALKRHNKFENVASKPPLSPTTYYVLLVDCAGYVVLCGDGSDKSLAVILKRTVP